MALTAPAAGDDTNASFAIALVGAINNLGIVNSSDVTIASGTFADLTGLSFPCTAGKNYTVEVIGTYQHSNTSGGPILSCTQPGGSHRLFVQLAGETAPDSFNSEVVSTNDGGAGVATAAVANTRYLIRAFGSYQCSSTGTFKLRIARNGTGTSTFEKGFMLRVVSD